MWNRRFGKLKALSESKGRWTPMHADYSGKNEMESASIRVHLRLKKRTHHGVNKSDRSTHNHRRF